MIAAAIMRRDPRPRPHKVGNAMSAATRTITDPDLTLEGSVLFIHEAPQKDSTRITAARATQTRTIIDHCCQVGSPTPSHQRLHPHQGNDPPKKARSNPTPIAVTV